MSRNTFRNTIMAVLAWAGLVSMLLSGLFLGTPSAAAGGLSQSQDDMNKLKGLTGKDFEVEFMTMMIAHHQSAIDMSKLVPERAKHQEVKDTAQQIISAQSKEITDMTGWLKQWHNVTPGTGMDMGGSSGMGMSEMTKLQGLKGGDFDKEFLTMMREHHMSAVEMAKLVPGRTSRSELTTLAQNIISSQTSEIKQFEGWLSTWFSAPGGASGTSAASSTVTPPDSMQGQGGNTSGDLPTSGSPTGMGVLWLLASVLLGAVAIVTGGVWLRKRA